MTPLGTVFLILIYYKAKNIKEQNKIPEKYIHFKNIHVGGWRD